MEVMEEIQQFINLEAIKKLPVEKKRAIIDVIEDTIEEEEYYEDDDEEETEEELRILDERIEHHRLNPDKAISLEDLQEKFLSRYK